MAVVSNSSVLILYSRLGRLDLLRELFGEIFIPQAVQDEVVTRGGDRPGAELVHMPWIRVQPLRSQERAEALLTELDLGEAEVIAIAEELDGQVLVLLDDRRGRRLAAEKGFQVLGTAGVLVLAKERGLISQVHPILDELLSAGLFLSDVAYHEVLAVASESPVDANDTF